MDESREALAGALQKRKLGMCMCAFSARIGVCHILADPCDIVTGIDVVTGDTQGVFDVVCNDNLDARV